MSLRKSQTGFSVFELVIIIVVVAIVGLASYVVYNRQHNKTVTTGPATSTSTASTVPSAPTINSTSDLDKATATLDQVDPSTSNSSDSSQLDSQLAAF